MSGNAEIISKTGWPLIGWLSLRARRSWRSATCSRNPFLWQHFRLGLCAHICNVCEIVTGFMQQCSKGLYYIFAVRSVFCFYCVMRLVRNKKVATNLILPLSFLVYLCTQTDIYACKYYLACVKLEKSLIHDGSDSFMAPPNGN